MFFVQVGIAHTEYIVKTYFIIDSYTYMLEETAYDKKSTGLLPRGTLKRNCVCDRIEKLIDEEVLGKYLDIVSNHSGYKLMGIDFLYDEKNGIFWVIDLNIKFCFEKADLFRFYNLIERYLNQRYAIKFSEYNPFSLLVLDVGKGSLGVKGPGVINIGVKVDQNALGSLGLKVWAGEVRFGFERKIGISAQVGQDIDRVTKKKPVEGDESRDGGYWRTNVIVFVSEEAKKRVILAGGLGGEGCEGEPANDSGGLVGDELMVRVSDLDIRRLFDYIVDGSSLSVA